MSKRLSKKMKEQKRPVNYRTTAAVRERIEEDASALRKTKEEIIDAHVKRAYWPKDPELPASEAEWQAAKAFLKFYRNSTIEPRLLKFLCDLLEIPVPFHSSNANKHTGNE